MLNKSYRGYKNKGNRYKRRFKPGNNKKKSVKDPEAYIVKFQLIRYVAIVMVGVILLGLVTAGFMIFNNENPVPNSNNYEQSPDNRSELLRVVNKNFPLESDYKPRLVNCGNYSINELAFSALCNMLDSAKSDKIDLQVDYAYVSYDEQDEKFRKEYNRLLKEEKFTEVTAEAKAQAVTPQAGNSEYQTGLLVKFKTGENKSFAKSKASKWLEKNCIQFGFIVRYIDAKKSKTLMNSDPGAYRYVGAEDAGMMRSLDMCLDEYFSYISVRE